MENNTYEIKDLPYTIWLKYNQLKFPPWHSIEPKSDNQPPTFHASTCTLSLAQSDILGIMNPISYPISCPALTWNTSAEIVYYRIYPIHGPQTNSGQAPYIRHLLWNI